MSADREALAARLRDAVRDVRRYYDLDALSYAAAERRVAEIRRQIDALDKEEIR